MISDEDKLLVLRAYTVGILTRGLTMEFLGLYWYVDLLDDGGMARKPRREADE